MFYTEDAVRLSSAFAVLKEKQTLTQLQGCVLDLLGAREAFTEQLEHLENAQANMQQFVGPGEDRWIAIGEAVHHIENVDGTVNITPYIREKTDAAQHL